MVAPMFMAQLGAVDDHWIVGLVRMRDLDLGQLPSVIANEVAADTGRFRPVFWAFRVGEASVWGTNPTGWYVDRALFVLATLAASVALAIPYVRPELAVIGGLLVVAGPQAEAWFRRAPQETYATPLAIGGLAAIGRGRLGLGLSLMILAALTKESFAPFFATAIGWLWFLGARGHAVAGAIAGIPILLGVVSSGAGAFYRQERGPTEILEAAAWLLAGTPLAAATIASLMTAAALRVALPGRWLLAGTALVVGPQAYIYAGASDGRFLLPGVLPLVAVLLISLSGVMARSAKVSVALMAMAGLIITTGVAGAFVASSARADDTRNFQVSIGEIVSALDEHPGAALVVTVHGYGDYEGAFSVRQYVHQGEAILRLEAPPPRDELETALSKTLVQISQFGGRGFSPWRLPDDCVEVRFHPNATRPTCGSLVVVTVR